MPRGVETRGEVNVASPHGIEQGSVRKEQLAGVDWKDSERQRGEVRRRSMREKLAGNRGKRVEKSGQKD